MKTLLEIHGEDFSLNGRPTYEGRHWRGQRIEGLLMNSRMIQGIFDDANPATRQLWDYPDGPWDADRNTEGFLAALPEWRAHGLLAFTIGLQGGSPQGYSNEQPWENSAFNPDGSLRPAYFQRLGKILTRADELGMAVIVSYFYFGQDERLVDEAAVIRATDLATDWLCDNGCRNVLVELVNESDVPRYEHPILCPSRIHELIVRVQERSQGKVASPLGRLLAGASMMGGKIPVENILQVSDVVLLHGNGVHQPAGIRKMIQQVRDSVSYRGQPLVFNEDDHFDFAAPDNNLIAAVEEHASWGFFDYRLPGEDFHQGYQSMPCEWSIGSDRKRGFFRLLKEITLKTAVEPG